MATPVPARLTTREGRRFGLTVGAAFGLLTALMWWRGHPAPMYGFGGMSLALLIAGMVLPARLGPVFRAWMGLAMLISRVTTPVFMGLVFFVVLVPIGLTMRLFGRNPIRHRPVSGSYWAHRSDARGTMRNQF